MYIYNLFYSPLFYVTQGPCWCQSCDWRGHPVSISIIIIINYLGLSFINIFLLHISGHSKVCHFTSFLLSNQHITGRKVSLNDLGKYWCESKKKAISEEKELKWNGSDWKFEISSNTMWCVYFLFFQMLHIWKRSKLFYFYNT